MSVAPAELAALAALAFAGSVVFGLTGFGAALVTIPLATHFVPLPFALALYVLMDLANALRVGLENPRNAVRAEWLRMVPAIRRRHRRRGGASRSPAAPVRRCSPSACSSRGSRSIASPRGRARVRGSARAGPGSPASPGA
ncbi:MAG: hypothetical protein RML56_09045 [Burkholderiales bacterium]|nr:hypothetical protein [Burkholderiales bacterium]